MAGTKKETENSTEKEATIRLLSKNKARVEVGLKVTVSRTYQSVSLSATYAQDCSIKDVDETFRQAWKTVEDQTTGRVDDAKEAVALLESWHRAGR